MKYDAIVVGAGPSGSASAYFLAEEGLSVLVLERENLPRPKLCAGALPPAVEELLGFGIKDAVEDEVREVTWIWRADRTTWRYVEPVLYTVMRDKFDLLLVERAKAAGAEVVDGEEVVSLEEGREEVSVRTRAKVYRCKFLVGADGAGSVVAKYVGRSNPERTVRTAEAEISVPYEFLKACEGRATVEFRAVPKGYGWIFPKADHLSVGVGGLRLRRAREHLKAFAGRRLPTPAYREVGAWAYPVWGARRRWARGRVLLVGDAGAFANPLTGAGIYTGIWSGLLASRAISKAISGGSLEEMYTEMILGEISPELSAARNLSIIYAIPGPAFVALKLGLLRGSFLKRSYSDIWRYISLGITSLWPSNIPSPPSPAPRTPRTI